MPALKYESFHSRNYEIIVDRLHGVHCIQQRATGHITLLATCSEGLADYRKLRAAWRKSRSLFEGLCQEYTYYQ